VTGVRAAPGDGDFPSGGQRRRASAAREETVALVLDGLDGVLVGLDSVRSGMADLPRPGGIPVKAGAVRLLTQLRAAGLAVAVVSSQHCREALAGSELDGLLDEVVDGEVAAAMPLPGRPDPAMYLEAARRLGVDPDRAAVIDDDHAAVAAASDSGFALVIGIDRRGDATALVAAGADFVVTDVDSLRPVGRGPLRDGWHLTYRPQKNAAGEGIRETLCTLANGYLGTRGAATWATDDGVHYPGTYLAGCYNRLPTDMAGHWVEHESIVNAPNWLPLSFSAAGGPFLADPGVVVSGQELSLDLRRGVLRRRYRVTDPAGRRTAVTERRLVSMADPHLAAIAMDLVAENWSGPLYVRSGIDATCCADQPVEAPLLRHCHLRLAGSGTDSNRLVWLVARTTQSNVLLAEAARTHVDGAAELVQPQQHDGNGVFGLYRVDLGQAARCHVEKVVAVYTSRDSAISEPVAAARQAAVDAPGFADLLDAHRAAWVRLWSQASTEIDADDGPVGAVNLHLFHLMQVAAPHVIDIDTGLGARGLHGEGYEGHVFWDELFVFPVLNLHSPNVSRALLRYRRRRLPVARRIARDAGETGVRFPWQSGSDGRDETPTALFNPRSRRWIPDRSANQRHVGLAVAYNFWQHWQTTGDDEFFFNEGMEVLFEVARHFARLATFDERLGRFRIRGMMGPDEFHDSYPWAEAVGVDDNAYTNVLTAWLLTRALELAGRLRHDQRSEHLGVDDAELALFDSVSRGLYVPFHDGVISQFAGYEKLEPIDLDAYRARYTNIGLLDLILEAEGDTVRRYQVGKQADTLMLCYLFSLPELRQILGRLGYSLPDETLQRTIDYYTTRATHGSTLSQVVHAWVAARADPPASWRHLGKALAADMADTQGGTKYGIHLGAMAGTIDILQRCYTGLDIRAGTLILDPALPDQIRRLHTNISYRGHHLDIRISADGISVASAPGQAASVPLKLAGRTLRLHPGRRVHRRLAAVRGRARASALSKPQLEGTMAITTDPVCGMTIEESTAAATATHQGTTYYFCSTTCRERFEAEPEMYTSPDQ
jgi:HAD superfamily hydrolase (TIGR01509 family)